MAKQIYDTVYYWIGGRERGEWRPVLLSALVDKVMRDKIEELNRLGYVAVRGCTSIGPPEGPPPAEQFEHLGL